MCVVVDCVVELMVEYVLGEVVSGIVEVDILIVEFVVVVVLFGCINDVFGIELLMEEV